MIGDDDVETQLARAGDLGDRRDAAVDGDQQARALLGQGLDGARRQPVAIAEAVGQVPDDLTAQRPQDLGEQERRP